MNVKLLLALCAAIGLGTTSADAQTLVYSDSGVVTDSLSSIFDLVGFYAPGARPIELEPATSAFRGTFAGPERSLEVVLTTNASSKFDISINGTAGRQTWTPNQNGWNLPDGQTSPFSASVAYGLLSGGGTWDASTQFVETLTACTPVVPGACAPGEVDESLFDIGGISIEVNFTNVQADYGDTWSLQVFDTSVPEPASWALMIGGLGLTGAAMRRRRGFVAG
jgi:hypothetical protein